MYVINEVASLTGLSAARLRTWEAAYGIVTPQRTRGDARLYDDDDIRRIVAMADLVAHGWTPRAAAAEILARIEAGMPAWSDDPHQHSPDSLLPFEAFLSAAERLDPDAARAAIRDGLSDDFLDVVDSWLMPALVALGDAWQSGRVSVAGEHLVSALIRTRLLIELDATSEALPSSGQRVLVGVPPASSHDLGALAFAVALQTLGQRVVFLGAELPSDQWRHAWHSTGAGAAVMSVPRVRDSEGAGRVMGAILAAEPAARFGVGGRYQHLVPDPAIKLGHSISYAARHLDDLLDEVADPETESPRPSDPLAAAMEEALASVPGLVPPRQRHRRGQPSRQV